MAPRHVTKCLPLLQKLDASYRRAKTNPLLGPYGDDHTTIPNQFHGYGFEDGSALTARVTSVKNAEAEVKKHFDRSYLISVADVYGAGSKKLDPSAPKVPATPGRKVKVNFNVKQHPDEGAKRIIKICIHRYHQTPPNAVQYAIEKTHTFFKAHPGADLAQWMEGQVKYYQKAVLEVVTERLHRIVVKTGGYAKWLDAGYHSRLEAFYLIFDSAPAYVTDLVFGHVNDAYDIENINGGGPEDTPLAKACRKFDRYKFGELMEDAFWCKRAPLEKDSQKLQIALFRCLCSESNPNISTFGLPEDWRDLPGKCWSDDSRGWGGYPSSPPKTQTAQVPAKRRGLVEEARGR